MKSVTSKILAVLAILFGGFICVMTRGSDTIYDVFRTAKLEDFLSGSLSGKLDRAVFDAVPRSVALDGFAAGLLYKGLHDAGPQVWAGCNDWLFSAEELRVDRRDAEHLAARTRMLPMLQEALAKRDILLVVLPVPDKAEQVEDQLCGVRADHSRWRAEVWAQAARSIHLHQVDLRKRWPHLGYWRTDTHWDSAGASFAADAVAGIVNGKLGSGSEKITLTSSAPRERPGDLARLAGLAESPRWLAPAAEYAKDPKASMERTGGLLDDTTGPSVILAGSSFSLNSGFIEYLQRSLSREVAQVSEAGGGFAGALIKLLDRKPEALAAVKVVIWEWPMRSLTAPLSAAEQKFLTQRPSAP